MNDHYFTENPASESHPVETSFEYRSCSLTFSTDSGVFSRGELDAGTRILLSALPSPLSGRVLDLGCGWGAVGVSVGAAYPACELVFSDVNLRALDLSRRNATRNGVNGTFVQSDGFARLEGFFDFIITNPPIRAGKQTIYQMFADSASHLRSGGALFIVIRKQQGAPSAIKYLSTLFTTVNVIEKSGGYWVIRCENGGNQA